MTTNRSTIEDEIVHLLAGIVNVDPSTFQWAAGLADVGITSIQLVEAIFVIEDRYGISIPYNANEQAGGINMAFRTVGSLLDLVVDLILAKTFIPQVA